MERRGSIDLRPPLGALELFVFSMHLSQWLPRGEWCLLQFDNSTFLSHDEELLLNSLFFEDSSKTYLPVLFDFVQETDEKKLLVQLSHFMFLLIMLQAHAQIVSSGGAQGEMIHILDGAVTLSGREPFKVATESWLLSLERAPLQLPDWAL
jgi:hypothetical protein